MTKTLVRLEKIFYFETKKEAENFLKSISPWEGRCSTGCRGKDSLKSWCPKGNAKFLVSGDCLYVCGKAESAPKEFNK